MLVSSLRTAFRTSSYLNISRRAFSVLDADYYHKVFDESLSKDTVTQKTIKVKIDTKGRTENIQLYGLPLIPLSKEKDGLSDFVKDILKEQDDQPKFLQIDPTKYLYSQRLVASKTDLPGVQSEEVQNMLAKDPIHPFSWDEALASTEILEKFQKPQETENTENNENNEAIIKEKEAEEQVKKMAEMFGLDVKGMMQRNEKIATGVYELILDTHLGKYPEMNDILVSSLMIGSPVILGGMPKILKRLILGNSLRLQDLKMIFKTCCIESEKAIKLGRKVVISQVAKYLFPDVFYAPDVIYMSVMLKEIMRTNKETFKAFVGIDYIDPIVDHWQDERIEGTKYSDIIGMPARNTNDNVETLIEKHVILDVLLGDRVWDLPYIKNQFPYLTAQENNDANIVELRKIFYVNFKRYSAAKQKFLGKDE